ncbi:GGDEF domain-containing protein [Magnetovibrio sp. PR-2]|uniref:GGDEF domain-containing protein n=1 Tax=Magnetovibrio sp. PR-2 TaxID=3120356 RepID=UPI002FCE491C
MHNAILPQGTVKSAQSSLTGTVSATTNVNWDLIRLAHKAVRPIGLACLVFGFVVFFGYVFGFESFYRPIHGGPATNPLTALCIVLIAGGLGFRSVFKQTLLQRVLPIIAAVLAFLRLSDVIIGTDFSGFFTPFHNTVVQELATGQKNAMGMNSALMLFSIAFAMTFDTLRKPMFAQVFAFIALGLPMTSFTGYAYGIEHFYGQMSLITAFIGLSLAIATLSLTAHRGAMRALLSPFIGGRIARFQVVLGYVVPFALGFLLVNNLVLGKGDSMFGLFVISVSWFIISLVSYSAVFQERVDCKRRGAERRLSFSAMVDPLTRLPNRRKIYEAGHREMERAKRYNKEFWLLMLDLDHFKNINDSGGHAMGDLVLTRVSDELKSCVRTLDVVGRWGGEEFVIILTDTELAGAIHAAEKVRKCISMMHIDGWTPLNGPITASIGCASSKNKSVLDDVFASADLAMYTAKDHGRNLVRFEYQV